MSVRPWLLLMAMAPSWTLHAPRYVRRRRITALTAADAGLTPALCELKASLCDFWDRVAANKTAKRLR